VSASCGACPVSRAPTRRRSIALLGNPNSGKTTIFKALTGLRQKVGNYPGVTVDKRTGWLRLPDGTAQEILDLPGTYSLIATSPDEQIITDVLRGLLDDTGRPDALVAVVDASNLPRNLYLVSQLLELGLPIVVALNMTDVAERRGQHIDPSALARALGCEVVPLVGHRRRGVEPLRAALARADAPRAPVFRVATAMRDGEERVADAVARAIGTSRPDTRRLARRLLIGDPAADVSELRRNRTVGRALALAGEALRARGVDPVQADIEARYAWIDGVVASATGTSEDRATPRTLTEKADAVLLHPVWGLAIFAVIMSVVFVAIFWAAKPLVGGVQAGVVALGKLVASLLPAGAVRDLTRDGIFGGVGSVFSFVPQVGLLFLLLSALEDTGYLARAAFLMDRLLYRVGLHGKSFVPLLSCFGCAIPGILSTRTIDSRRERLTTILVAPFMSCSARLPVYALLIAACFATLHPLHQGLVLLCLYALGIGAAAVTALLVRGGLGGTRASTFILEMPTYKIPQASQVLWQAFTHTRAFVTRAGTTIFALSIVLWALLYYPRLPAHDGSTYATVASHAAAQVEHSFAGRFGHAIEPAVRPLGYDWRIAVGLVGAFAAREVFVSTLGITYSVAGAGQNAGGVTAAMQTDKRPDGSPVWTRAVALSLMAWFVLAMQCMSTMAVVRRETGGWRWPLAQALFMNALAYVVALGLYRLGIGLWGS
jgi:ferrous iron transport protein B